MSGDGSILIVANNYRLTSEELPEQEELTPGEYVRLDLTDVGIGMSSKVKAQAFEPFFTTKSPGKGTGLGLSMVHGFARQSGGFVTIDSTPEVGTTISVYLPRYQAIRIAAPPVDTSADDAPYTINEGASILVVEDDDGVREVICEVLKGKGYTVEPMPDGNAALERLQRGPSVDLVISDIIMPGDISGMTLADWISSNDNGTGLLLVTGHSSLALGAGSRSGSIAEFPVLRKPFNGQQLTAAVDDILNGNV
jgi:CheY-like chemotaxis protein